MNLQQRVIGHAMLANDKTAAVRYSQDGETKVHSKSLTQEQLPKLIRAFGDNPQTLIRSAVECIDEIKKDPTSSSTRVSRYLTAYQGLLIELDKHAFERSDTKIHTGVPIYIPDGLSDMGSNSSLTDSHRNREKQYVDKVAMFRKSEDLFDQVATKDKPICHISTIRSVARFVYQNMPFDHKEPGRRIQGVGSPFGGSIPNSDFIDTNKSGAVCRNQALYAQVLLQTLGIKSQLLKCNLDFGRGKNDAHVASLIQGKNAWYLLDVTNPIMKDGESAYGMITVPDSDIDVNKNTYTWTMPTDGGNRTYTSRNNMYYRLKE